MLANSARSGGWVAAVVGIIAGVAPLSAALPAAPSARPNIVFILADDLGINDLACYGRAEHHTPNLDRLAQQGARFTNAYAAASVCSPTRAALMTGKAPAELGITTFLDGRKDTAAQPLLQAPLPPGLAEGQATIASDLHEAGYRTGIFGKWHLGKGPAFDPTTRGFDVYGEGPARTSPSETEGGKGEYHLTRGAIDFIRETRDQPFFVYLAHHAPHIPYDAKQRLIAANRDAFEPVYAAVIESLDATVGLVLDALQEQGLSDNTIVIFSSDNGGLHVPEGPHERITHGGTFRAGKGFLYEGGLRVPLIVRWPGTIPPGTMVETPVMLTDWRPTARELVGMPALEELDGRSLMPLLKGDPSEKSMSQRSLCWHEPHYTNQGGRPGAAIRQGDWKLIEFFGEQGGLELYNLADDPGETRDRSVSEPRRVQALKAALEAWQARVHAVRTGANPAFDPALYKALYVDFDPSRYRPATADEQELQRAIEWRAGMNRAVAAGDAPRRRVPAAPATPQ